MSERLRAFWSQASPRERVLVALGALVVVGSIGHAFVWEPLTRDLDSTGRALVDARANVEEARKAAGEIAGLRRDARAPRTADARAAAERVIFAQGLRAALTALDAREGRVRLTFAAIDVEALSALLEQLGREEQLFPREALLAARVAPGSVRAELTLSRPPAR